MNQSIRELAEQAGYEADLFGVGHWNMPECQKFLELIVRECGNIAFEHWALTHSTSPQEAILKHFGVEE
jgi:hypothetical protein